VFSLVKVHLLGLGRLVAGRRRACALSLVAAAAVAWAQPANPPSLVYATYAASSAGGSGVSGLAVDSEGYAYLGGGYYPNCAFLTKLNQAGTAAIWSRQRQGHT